MKKAVIISVFSLLSIVPSGVVFGGVVPGGAGRYPAVRHVRAPQASWHGDSLYVRFSSDIAGRLRGVWSLHLVPMYISGKDTVRYPEVGYFTPSGVKYHKRREALSDRKTDCRVRIYRGRRASEDYASWRFVPASMGSGELQLHQRVRTCCAEYTLAVETVSVPARRVEVADTVYSTVEVVGSLPLPVAVVSVPLFEANVTFLQPKAEAVKERTATATIRIDYPMNHWQVYPDFGDNAAELSRVDAIFSPLAQDTATYRILRASITGYASPEDTWQHNMQLSEKRAGGMRDYVQRRYGFPGGSISVQGRGEDWDGLRAAVEKSGMASKREVLAIIDSYDIFDGREKRLMDLQGGEPYKYMLRTLFPPLRRMEMRIDYRVRAFGEAEAGELFDTRPQDLSLLEMYGVARSENTEQTIIRRRSEYGREYDIAVRYFPDSDIANINASSAALVRGDLEVARLCLSRVQEHPMAANNLGVYHWLCGKIAEAESYFEQALTSDPERAAYNLEQLRRWKEEFGHEDDEQK